MKKILSAQDYPAIAVFGRGLLTVGLPVSATEFDYAFLTIDHIVAGHAPGDSLDPSTETTPCVLLAFKTAEDIDRLIGNLQTLQINYFGSPEGVLANSKPDDSESQEE
jgi:hypothetical protein